MNFVPTFDRVLIKPDVAPEKSAGGIHLPENFGTGDKVMTGVVVASGPGMVRDGSFVNTVLMPGAHVAYSRNSGIEVEVEGEKFLVMGEVEVLGCFSK